MALSIYNAASDIYNNGDPLTRIPRLKFNFELEFVLNDNIQLEDASFGKSFTFHRVQSVGLPDFDYNIAAFNQYNRMRYIPTRLTIQPFSATFYDTKDNQFQTLLKAYTKHYYHSLELDARNFRGYDAFSENFSNGSSHDFGAKSMPNEGRFFFPEIRIHQIDSSESGRTIIYYNNMMTSSNHDRLDYSDSTPIIYNVQFQPEHVNIYSFAIDDTNRTDSSEFENDKATIPTIAPLVPQDIVTADGTSIPIGF